MPYTTGCKLAIAARDDGDKANALFAGGKLTPEAEVAVREIHNRFDVDLDRLLDQREFVNLISDLTGKHLVLYHLVELVPLPCRVTLSSSRPSSRLTTVLAR